MPRRRKAAGAEVLIISSDKDLMQLVGDHVEFYDFESGTRGRPGYRPERRIDRQGVIDYFGVPPEKVIDVQSLVGDTSDNVPGVPGIGIKTASALIGEYGDLDTLLANAESIKQPKRRQLLIDFADQARMSRTLVTLHDDVDAGTPLSATRKHEPDPAKLIAFLKAIELSALTKRVAEAYAVDPNAVEADPAIRSAKHHDATFAARLVPHDDNAHAAPATTGEAASGTPPPPLGGKSAGEAGGEGGAGAESANGHAHPTAAVAAGAQAATAVPFDRTQYETVTALDRLDAWIAEATAQGHVAIDSAATGSDPMQADLCGVSLALAPGRACYVPLAHKSGEADLLGDNVAPGQIPAKEALARLKPLMEDAAVLKIAQNLKFDTVLFARLGHRCRAL